MSINMSMTNDPPILTRLRNSEELGNSYSRLPSTEYNQLSPSYNKNIILSCIF